MSKKLKLTFNTDGGGTMDLSIADPAEGLTMTTVKAAAEKITPALMTSAGAAATGLKSAVIVTTETTDIPEA